MDALHPVFYPASIAVVGASKDQTKRGFRSIQKLIEDGFPGPIYPVHPRETSILGRPAYPMLAHIPGPVDLALICTPARAVPDVIAQCGEKGVKGAVVLAGGFAEAGPEGAELQARMIQAAEKGGVRIIGPNTSGIFNTHARANIVGFSHLRPGGIALLSQSGNMALSLVTEAQANGHVGLSVYVGIGNESDVRFHEYLEFLRTDPKTEAIVAYVEGLKDGRKFLDALRKVTREKPVVIYKSGRTHAGRKSAQSHTGALAGDYAVSAGVLKQAGAVLARKSDEILSLAESLSLLKPLRSRRIAVLADGGGHATIAADVLTEHGLQVAVLESSTRSRLAAILPPSAAVANPVDVAGGTDSNPAVFAECAELLLADPGVDALLVTGLFGGYAVRFAASLAEVELETSRRIADLHRQHGKPVMVHSLYGSLYADLRPRPLSLIRELGIPVHDSLELSVRCLEALAEWGDARSAPNASHAGDLPRAPRFESVLQTCRREHRRVVLEHEARQALEEVGVPMLAPARLVSTADEAVAAFNGLGGVPVAMKIVSKDIIHKTDAGAVKLGLSNEASIRDAHTSIMANAREYTRSHSGADPVVSGVLVTPMAPAGGVQVIIGVVRDATFGPVLMFGMGGILVEVMKDVVFRSLPMDEADAMSMLEEIRAAKILDGVRGAPAVDKQALVRLMLAVSRLCTAFPEIAELDLNPVMAYPDGVGILDARMLLETVAGDGVKGF
jgi:acetate---CoA ligase (ADP-forming)